MDLYSYKIVTHIANEPSNRPANSFSQFLYKTALPMVSVIVDMFTKSLMFCVYNELFLLYTFCFVLSSYNTFIRVSSLPTVVRRTLLY